MQLQYDKVDGVVFTFVKWFRFLIWYLAKLYNLGSTCHYSWTCLNQIEEFIEAVEEGEIPQPWLDVAYPTMADLDGFLADLKERTDFLRDWQVNGPPRLVSFCKGGCG